MDLTEPNDLLDAMAEASDRDDATLQSDFVAWCEREDRAALGRVFVATAPRLGRLARRLLPDRHAAEDAVQATFLTAMAERAAFDPARPVMPWLVGLLINRVRTERRARRSLDTPRSEAIAARAAQQPAVAAEHAELRAAIQRALAALPRDYRSIASLHLTEGHTAKEIAELLGRPRGTVRAQVSRAMAMLRRRLETVLVVVFGGLFGRSARADGRVQLRTGSPIAPSHGPVPKSLLGVGIMACVALLTLSVTDVGEVSPPPTARTEGSTDIALESSTSAEHRAGDPGPRRAVLAAGVPVSDPAGPGAVEVRVSWTDGAPAAGTVVTLLSDQQEGPLHARPATAGADGIVRFDALGEGGWLLHAARGARTQVRLGPGEQRRLELELPPGVEVRGRVLDGDDRPLPGAQILLVGPSISVEQFAVVATTDELGRFALRDVAPGCKLAARAAGCAASLVLVVGGGREQPFEFRCPPAAAAVTGTVRDAEGAPIAGARVCVGTLGPLEARGQRAPAVAHTDADGRFRLDCLLPGRTPVWVGADGLAPWWGQRDLPVGGTTDLDVRLERPVTLRGRVTDPDGTPVPRAVVSAEFAGLERGLLAGPPWAFPRARSDADGRYELRGIRPVSLLWRAASSGGDVCEPPVRRLAPGAEARWDPVLPQAAVLRGRLVDARGEPLAGWLTWLSVPGSVDRASRAVTGAAGDFAVSFPAADRHALWIADPDAALLAPLLLAENLDAGQAGQRFVVPDRLRCTARVRGHVGGPPAEIAAVRCDTGKTLMSARSVEDGSFLVGPLPPGEYVLVRSATGVVGAEVRRVRLGPGEEFDLGLWSHPGVGRLQVSCAGPLAWAVAGITLRCEGRPGVEAIPLPAEGDLVVWPGRYRIEAVGPDVIRDPVEVEIAPGTRTTATLRARPGVASEIVIPPFGRAEGTLSVVLERVGEASMIREWLPWPPPPFFCVDEAVTVPAVLAPGGWRVRIRDGTGRTSSVAVSVGAFGGRAVLPPLR